jgi:hypothetical protein
MRARGQSRGKSKEDNKQKDGYNSLVINYRSGIV